MRDLTAAGWQVEAEGKIFRTAGAFKIEISSGIDWFELRGTVEFGDRSAPLPALLAALRRNDNTVLLDDGSMGILPEEWLRKYGILAGLGTSEGDHLRFSRCQMGLLDALLAAEPAASCDEVFERARARLREFDGVAPADAAQGFCGELVQRRKEGSDKEWTYTCPRGYCRSDAHFHPIRKGKLANSLLMASLAAAVMFHFA